ncbi:hypothetical protein [Saccharibacillus alkalitolerans]|uniref:2TM domain-containing protein n=1 Tax=Saccharibacillus alkalitolerans TaxID=2705290 RepID=A0ABX0FDC2_9BACL|nr:hypothetical protein [Saccharibacillus alkalitolerans]NGZ78159.1 hypothetical protein [Saccharibacillus alkalitolerans]
MIGWLIIGCEVGFWVLVAAGLAARYLLKQRKLGALLLLLTPVVDLVLLAATVIDIRGGAEVNFMHGLAAVYIGATVAYGHRMIKWADERAAYRFAGGERPKKGPKRGREHAAAERKGWYRHLLAWTVGSALLAIMILLISDADRAAPLKQWIVYWALILGVDFLISFSYSLWPRKAARDL